MNFLFDNSHFTDIEAAEGGCYLIANGLGGYSCLDLAGGTSRNDHAIFMAAVKAPNVRYNMITNLLIDMTVDGIIYHLSTQRMADDSFTDNFKYIEKVCFDSNMFSMVFNVRSVRLELCIVMPHGENTLMLNYHISNPECHDVELRLTPLLRFTPKNTAMKADAEFSSREYAADKADAEFSSGEYAADKADAKFSSGEYAAEKQLLNSTDNERMNGGTGDNSDINCCEGLPVNAMIIEGNGLRVVCASNMDVELLSRNSLYSIRWTLDTRDGRDDTGSCVINHCLKKRTSEPDCENVIVYSLCAPEDILSRVQNDIVNAFNKAEADEKARIADIVNHSGLKSELGRQLAAGADAYIVERESTGGKTIIAGYPFFEDWGRDTMIALGGTTLAAARYSDCRSILKTFAKYEKNGLLPNLFPEGGMTPMYNSADAPLLFVNAVYEYIQASGDNEFLHDCFEPMKNIMDAYENGTDFHIGCDTDGLIMAGADLEQLTWMDVRVDNFLPTPRHGKPVEINAYWYSALCAMQVFAHSLGKDELSTKYAAMAERTRKSFLEKFYDRDMGCLKDVLNGTYEEKQIRCNQVWTLTMPFTMPDSSMAEQILDTIEKKLYTTAGLRTLTMDDPAFTPVYIGDMQHRDRAYHQGTVWTFPLGAYLRARVRQLSSSSLSADEKNAVREHLKEAFSALEGWLYEGCLGQFAEIYDGECPTISRGCFAQAWSVGEILRAVSEYEKEEQNAGN